mgnify:CR=1 FL=1
MQLLLSRHDLGTYRIHNCTAASAPSTHRFQPFFAFNQYRSFRKHICAHNQDNSDRHRSYRWRLLFVRSYCPPVCGILNCLIGYVLQGNHGICRIITLEGRWFTCLWNAITLMLKTFVRRKNCSLCKIDSMAFITSIDMKNIGCLLVHWDLDTDIRKVIKFPHDCIVTDC